MISLYTVGDFSGIISALYILIVFVVFLFFSFFFFVFGLTAL